MNRRRFALLTALTAFIPASARAQVALSDCAVGFVNGVLQVDPECAMTLPGTSFPLSPPSHLITAFPTDTTEATDSTSRKERRRAQAKARLEQERTQEQRRQDNARLQDDRKKTNAQYRQIQRDARLALRRANQIQCSDFLWQQDAQVFFVSSEYDPERDRRNLDPNDNGMACENLPRRNYCLDFKYQEDAQEFFKNSEYDNVNDPWDLDPNGDGDACESLPKKPPTP